MKTKDMIYISLYAALFAVFEYISVIFNIFQMPQGGSVSLGVIVLILASYQLGVKRALIVTLIALIIMLMMKPPYFLNLLQFMFDYILAFGVYALSGLVPSPKGIPLGVLVSNFFRFLFHSIGGWIFFSAGNSNQLLNLWISMVYNASYMIPTTILSFIVVAVLLQTPFFKKQHHYS